MFFWPDLLIPVRKIMFKYHGQTCAVLYEFQVTCICSVGKQKKCKHPDLNLRTSFSLFTWPHSEAKSQIQREQVPKMQTKSRSRSLVGINWHNFIQVSGSILIYTSWDLAICDWGGGTGGGGSILWSWGKINIPDPNPDLNLAKYFRARPIGRGGWGGGEKD